MDPATDARAIAGVGDSIVYAFSSGLGWLLAIVGLAAIREKKWRTPMFPRIFKVWE